MVKGGEPEMNATTGRSEGPDQGGPGGAGGVGGQKVARRTGEAAYWTTGLSMFAALILITSGAFQLFEGLAALIRSDYFVVTEEYAFQVDVTAWGWIHLVLGAVLIMLGVGVLRGVSAARYTAMALAVLSAMVHFLFIPYEPVWSVLIIALNIAVIWALAAYRPERT
jgi:hypothetical protein